MTDIVGFMPTPFTADDTVDHDRLRVLAASIASRGVHPAVLGGMGEFYALDLDEATECMSAAVEGAAGAAPVVAGIGHDTRTAVRLASAAARTGVGLIVANPLYYAVPSARGYAEHIRAIAGESGLPVIIYSAPSYPATESLIESMLDIEGFAGVKEENYGIPETAKRIAIWGDRLRWWGVGEQVGCDFAQIGASTVTTSLANVDADAAVAYISARLAGVEPDPVAADLVIRWESAMAASQEGSPTFLTEAMRQHAGWSPAVRLPMLPMHDDDPGRAQIAQILTISDTRRRSIAGGAA